MSEWREGGREREREEKSEWKEKGEGGREGRSE